MAVALYIIRNLNVCMISCRAWDIGADRRIVCRHNQQIIQSNAEADECPHPKGRQFESRGLGDTVATVIQKVTGKAPCGGCAERRDKLNQVVPYKK